MAEAILSFAVQSIGKLLFEEGKFLPGVSDQVGELHADLRRMQWFVKYADSKQGARDNIQQWLSEFREIAYEANDVIEDYAFRVASHRKDGFRSTLKRYACIFNESHARHNLGLEVQTLRRRISDLTKNLNEYGVPAILQEDSSSLSLQELRRTRSFVEEEDFVKLKSLDADVEMIVQHLLNEEAEHCSFVSIYGMGGLGKTTLAKQVYHHPRLESYFSGFAWACVSQKWQSKDIFQGILLKLVPQQRSEILSSSEEELAKRLHQVLQNERCLIVLDDIWSKDAWNCLKYAFSISNQGSKILLTSRNRDVGLHIGPQGYHHQPSYLDAKESWELLQKKALEGTSGIEDVRTLEELGKKMVEYCGGLPLAVVVLGGILRKKKSPMEWSIVHENIKSYLEKSENIGQQEGEMPRILAFSYYDLPYQLKPCFLYLGKFQEDSDIQAEMLYQMWVAEGMVFENDKIGQESMTDVAERYLEELAKRCMVHVELEEEPTIRRFKSCRLHDLMRDLSLLKAKEESFSSIIDFRKKNNTDTSLSFQNFYRLVILLNQEDFFGYVPPRKEQAKHLRSFMFIVLDENNVRLPRRIKSQFRKFKMLRVLVIEGLRAVVGGPKIDGSQTNIYCNFLDHFKLPKSIGKLIHLRYLSLRGSSFFMLPSSLGKLEYLETLDLSDAIVVRVPNVLWRMKQLRHLYLPNQECNLSCSKLVLDGLNKLETLEFYSDICDAKSLSSLTSLRSMSIRSTVYWGVDDLAEIINQISKLSHLQFTALEITGDFLDTEEASTVIQKMLFCKNIHKLEIRGNLCRQLPDHQPHFSQGLSELTLTSSCIEEDPMGTLGKFPNLRTLQLSDESFVGREIICQEMGFPQLKTLVLSCLPNLEKWKVDEGSMPKLSHLQIWGCPRLEMLPDGLRFITNLKELDVSGMPLEFTDRVRIGNGQEGEDAHKVRHVPNIIVTRSRLAR